MKKWILGLVFLIMAVAMYGQLSKKEFMNSGVMDIRTVEDAYKLDYKLNFIVGEDEKDEKEWYTHLKKEANDYIEHAREVEYVAIVRATGNFRRYHARSMQEITVEKVIKGSGIEEGKIYDLYTIDDFRVDLDTNELQFSNSRNILDPACLYLVLLEVPRTYKGERVKKDFLYADETFFDVLNITRDGKDYVKGDLSNIRYNDVKDFEFFAGSKRVLNELNKIKHTILSEYLGKLYQEEYR